MWSFVSVHSVEQAFGQWVALVTLAKNGVEESFFLRFQFTEAPSMQFVASAGEALARRKSIEEAPLVQRVITRQEFVGRFTLAELAAILAATASNATLAAYFKKLEMYDTVSLDAEDTIAGVNLLESVGLIGAGRATQILGA